MCFVSNYIFSFCVCCYVIDKIVDIKSLDVMSLIKSFVISSDLLYVCLCFSNSLILQIVSDFLFVCLCVRLRGSTKQEEGTSKQWTAKQSNTGKCLLHWNLLSTLWLS